MRGERERRRDFTCFITPVSFIISYLTTFCLSLISCLLSTSAILILIPTIQTSLSYLSLSYSSFFPPIHSHLFMFITDLMAHLDPPQPKQGWLDKRGEIGLKQWSRRWFTLDESGLQYYVDKEKSVQKGSVSTSCFLLSSQSPLLEHYHSSLLLPLDSVFPFFSLVLLCSSSPPRVYFDFNFDRPPRHHQCHQLCTPCN